MSEGNGLPDGWVATTMESLGILLCGTSPTTATVNKNGKGTPYVSGPEQWDGFTLHLDKWTTEPRRVVPDGCIFITVKGAGVGKLFPGQAVAIGRDIYAFLPHEGIDRRLVQHALQYTVYELVRQAKGDIPGLSKPHILEHPIDLAPEHEQTRIADRIDELFTDLAAGVAALERVKKNLKRYRLAVLHAAVTGQLTEGWRKEHGPPAESGKQLLDRLLVERLRQWEERTLTDYEAKGVTPPKNWRQRYQEPVAPKTDDLPDLPEGWCWSSMDQLANVTGGVAKNAKQEGATGMRDVPYLRVANVQRGYLDLSEMKTISAKERDIEDLTLQDGDVLFTEGGDRDKLGRGWVWRSEINECIHQNHVFRARLIGRVNAEFVSHVGNGFGQRWFWVNGKQSVNLASISLGVLRQFPVPLPSTAEQNATIDAISEKLSQIDEMEAEVTRGLARAARLRQAILKAAFAGALVKQNPKDEPASVLLERIQSESEAIAAKSNGRPKRASRKKAAPRKKAAKTAKKKSIKKKART